MPFPSFVGLVINTAVKDRSVSLNSKDRLLGLEMIEAPFVVLKKRADTAEQLSGWPFSVDGLRI